MRTVPAPTRLVVLSAAIYAAIKFKPEGCESKIEPARFSAEIDRLDLDSLLRLVRFLAATDPNPVLRGAVERTDLTTAAKIADAAARVLEDWPRELCRNLEHRIPRTVSRCADLSPRIIFGKLYWRMLRELPRETFKFLHEAIEGFVIRSWKGPIYGGKGHFSADTRGQLKWYTLTQARRIVHKNLEAMKELVGSGVVRSEIIRDGAGHEKIYVDRESLDHLQKEGQSYVSYSEVERLLGLANFQVLNLAKAGMIRCVGSADMGTQILSKSSRYSLEDVLTIERAFASALVRTSGPMTGTTEPVMSLREALGVRFVDSEEGLPAIIRSVIENHIKPITQVKDAPGIMGYAFRLDDLNTFKHKRVVSIEAPRGYMKYGEAANLIGTERRICNRDW